MATANELENKLITHEAICAERYNTFITRVDRLEKLLIKAAGTLIMGMAGVIIAIITRGI
tara:strand:+ start:200 stop:379 length:180 start_codon:yes stop_codon:yes gene_type:complete